MINSHLFNNPLNQLELLEATQLNLGLYTTHITVEDLHRAIEETEGTVQPLAEIETALHDLITQGEVIEWRPGYFRSRIAETVRCLRLLRQRLWWQKNLSDAALLIEDIRVEFRQRRRPKRDAVTIGQAIPVSVPSQVAQAFQEAVGIASFSGFQARAIEQIYTCAKNGNPHNESFIVAGDTGAGKTEAFLFPILLDIASEPPELRQQPGVRAVLVYPRIRLARNQLGRLLRYSGRFQQAGGPRLIVGIQNGDVPDQASSMENKHWRTKTDQGRIWVQLGLLETCVECKEGQYWFAADDPAIDAGCPTLTCDHCQHTITTLCITQAALQANAPDILIITDVSLSQWLTREKYSHLWGLWQGETITIPPRFLVLDEVHLYERLKGAHIARLIKRFQTRVRLVYQHGQYSWQHPLVIGVSATLNDEQRFLAKLLDIDPKEKVRYNQLRVIKPLEDELELTNGRERYIFIYPRRLSPTPRSPQYRVNDQAAAIQIVMAAMHNLKPNNDVEWRGLAFFDSINDLRQFRHNYDADPALHWIAGHDPTGQEIPPANQDELWRIRTDRAKTDRQTFDHCDSTCETRAKNGTLDQCRHFQAGDCWIFAKLHGWNQRLKVADSVYAGAASQLDGQHLIPTSPSLEVGYDDDHIQLVYQHKAPPNTASFIQRRGRAGRNPDDSPVIITLLWPYRRDDAFYFFHPEALYAPKFDDAPLNAGNFNVQRTHALLAFFDLLACLRRQNIDGLRDDPQILDFTQAGWHDFAPGDNIVQDFHWQADPKRPGQQRLIIKHRQTKQTLWFSGGQLNYIRQQNSLLFFKGWLAMANDLTDQILLRAWQRLSQHNLLANYLALSEIASTPFKNHRSYPFLVPAPATLPRNLINQFGRQAWHSANEPFERGNWLKTYRHIDWMLQGSEEATTLTVHHPNPDFGQPGHDDESMERTIDVTFGLTEFLPGNVSYRLRERQAIHWTPIPPKGQSTFLYPEEDSKDDEGNLLGRRLVKDFLPLSSDITSRPDSIFGVPRYLDDRFPGLPFISLKRLRVESFGPPNQQYSPHWVFVPDPNNPHQEGYALDTRTPGVVVPDNAFPISRRSSARADSVIIPYIAASRDPKQRILQAPLSTLFGAIDGFLEEGSAQLGYTRVFYEMQIDVKARDRNQNLTLHRLFYPPEPEQDETDQPKPVLIGYAIETQGIRFQLNPDLIAQSVEAILDDDTLRLHLRRNFAIYKMAPLATQWEVFIKSHLDMVEVMVDYWLHEVVPNSVGEPRLLDPAVDYEPVLNFLAANRVVRQEEINEFANQLRDDLFTQLNQVLQVAFQDTLQFRDFVESVLLHSLSSLLKNLVARLAGVGSDDLVAYTDMPILDQVDRTVDPRILIMDTIEGGSGGIAQAFERLDLTNSEGSLWWMFQTELGRCPIANGEALVRAVLTQATPNQILAVQQQRSEESLDQLLMTLNLAHPAPGAKESLGRVLFNEIDVGQESLNPALMLQELLDLQAQFDSQVPGIIPHQATIRRTTLNLDPAQQPYITALRDALAANGVAPNDLLYELALQLRATYESGCNDGCPVCLREGSDIENYYLAPLLNSRRVLKKLREVLEKAATPGDCLAALSNTLMQQQPVQINTPPGSLGNRLDPSLGLAVVAQVDETGQVTGASAVKIVEEDKPDRAREFLVEGKWEERWGGPEHKPYETPGGVRVRSRAEYIIATKLEAAHIGFEYEPRLPYKDEHARTQFIHPDFYLYEHNLYVEYWGRDDREYVESRQFKEQVYEQLLHQRPVRVLHLEAGDVEHDVFMNKIRAKIGSEDTNEVSDEGSQ